MNDASLPPVQIRRATIDDAAALAELAARTFTDTYGSENTPENMAAHLSSAYGVAQQSRELADPAWITLVADSMGALMGYTQVRRSTPPPAVVPPNPVEIYRFYIDRPWHGRGLAYQLMDAAHLAASDLGGDVVWLGVWEKNARARAFYARCCFVDVGETTFMVGPDRQNDRVLVAPLSRSAGRSEG